MRLQVRNIERFPRGKDGSEDAVLRRHLGEPEVTLQSPGIALRLLPYFQRYADQRRALGRKILRLELAAGFLQQVKRAAAGGDHLVHALHDQTVEACHRGIAADRRAEIMQEGEHALLLALEGVQFLVLRAELPFDPADGKYQADQDRG